MGSPDTIADPKFEHYRVSESLQALADYDAFWGMNRFDSPIETHS